MDNRYRYTIKDQLLIFHTPSGTYRFAVEEDTPLDHTHAIARLIIHELEKASRLVNPDGDTVTPYVEFLLAGLNLSKQVVQLKTRLNALETSDAPSTGPSPAQDRPQSTPAADSHTEAEAPALSPDIIEELKDITLMLSSSIGGDAQRSDPVEAVPKEDGPNDPAVDAYAQLETPAADHRHRHELETGPINETAPTTRPEPAPDEPAGGGSELPGQDKAPQDHDRIMDAAGDELETPLTDETNRHEPVDSPSDQAESPDTAPEALPEALAQSDSSQEETLTPETCDKTTQEIDPDPYETEPPPRQVPIHTHTDRQPELRDRLSYPSSPASDSTPHSFAPVPDAVKSLTGQGPNDPAAVDSGTSSFGRTIAESGDRSKTDKPFQLPPVHFLKKMDSRTQVDQESIRRDAELLEKKLGYFGIKGEVMGVLPGPVITTFEYKPDPGTKISKIVNLADDLALALSAYSIRIVAPIPGKDVMGIEIPNLKKSLVPFIDVVTSPDFTHSPSKVPICLGKDIVGRPVVVELEKMPHLLIAGATGTGKSVGLNAMITSILYKSKPDQVKFLMIDPKRIELSLYNDIPHLITPVVTDMKKATTALKWMVREMERRYDLLAEYQVRNIEQFNEKLEQQPPDPANDPDGVGPLCYIVIIIDELADLMMTASRDVEFSLTRLAQMARAAGIHLILATQRPSVDVLTGIIKANFPTRISFQVSSKTDSRTIIDANGAETLLGMGDMLFVPPGTARLTRVHGTYVSEEELLAVTRFIKDQGAPEYLLDVLSETVEEDEGDYPEDEYDEKYHEALEYVMTSRQASISGIQRALRVGYNRAARIIDLMEKKGIVGPSDGAKPRQVIAGGME